VARTQPVVGAHAFSHESGIHIAAILQDPETYEYFSPEMVGGERKFILGKHTGSKALEYVVSALGFQLSKGQVCRVLELVKTEGEHKTVVTPERLLELIKRVQGEGSLA
jgi:methanogen homocitrate synthase